MTNPEAYLKEYAPAATTALSAAGGKFLARGRLRKKKELFDRRRAAFIIGLETGICEEHHCRSARQLEDHLSFQHLRARFVEEKKVSECEQRKRNCSVRQPGTGASRPSVLRLDHRSKLEDGREASAKAHSGPVCEVEAPGRNHCAAGTEAIEAAQLAALCSFAEPVVARIARPVAPQRKSVEPQAR